MKPVQTIHFSLTVLSGDALPGNDSDALLVLQNDQQEVRYEDDEIYEDPQGEEFHSPVEAPPFESAINDDLVAKMMDQFPSVNHAEVARVVEEQRQLLMPLEDPLLLQDMVSIKLTALSIGSNQSRRSSKIARNNQVERKQQESFEGAAANPAMAVMQPEVSVNTITRIELDNFLIMAALSLVRKL